MGMSTKRGGLVQGYTATWCIYRAYTQHYHLDPLGVFDLWPL